MRRSQCLNRLFRFSGVVLAVLLAVACDGPAVQSGRAAPSELDGAWSLVCAETIAPDGTRIPGSAQESFLLISGGYYSLNWAHGAEPSEYFVERFEPTDDEKLARYGKLVVNAGRLEREPGLLTIHPLFALVPEYVGGLGEFDYKLDGETLELVWRTIESADAVPDPNTAVGVRFASRWQRIPR